MFWWSQSLDVWKIQWVFCLIFVAIKTKTNQRSLNSPAFFKILKEALLVKKQTIPHMKASILSFFEPERQGCGIIMRAPHPPPIWYIHFLSEVVEAKWGWWNKKWIFYIKSPYLRIPKIIGFWLQCYQILKKCSSEMHQFESADPV